MRNEAHTKLAPPKSTRLATLRTSIFFHHCQPPDRTLSQDGGSGRWSLSSPPRRQNPNLHNEQHNPPSRAHTSRSKPSRSLKWLVAIAESGFSLLRCFGPPAMSSYFSVPSAVPSRHLLLRVSILVACKTVAGFSPGSLPGVLLAVKMPYCILSPLGTLLSDPGKPPVIQTTSSFC